MSTSIPAVVNAVMINDEGEIQATATVAANNNNNNTLVDVVGERSLDEVEGSLLPVVAIPVNATTAIAVSASAYASNNAMAAVPAQMFDYDEALAKEQQEENESQRPLLEQQQEENDEDVAIAVTAVPLPASLSHARHLQYPDSIADDSRMAVNFAQHTGVIRAEEELQAIRTANRKVYAQTYWQDKSIQTANEMAKRRDREGLQVKEDHVAMAVSLRHSSLNTDSEKSLEEKEDDRKPAPGYEVQEYNIEDEDYETSNYEVQDYKSVYD